MDRCDKCNSTRLLAASTFCCNALNLVFQETQYTGYVPEGYNIGESIKQLEFTYCMDCGKMQGTFPMPMTKMEIGMEGIDEPKVEGLYDAEDGKEYKNPYPVEIWPEEHSQYKAGYESAKSSE